MTGKHQQDVLETNGVGSDVVEPKQILEPTDKRQEKPTVTADHLWMAYNVYHNTPDYRDILPGLGRAA